MNRRVVITGMGIWSCIGQDLKTVTESLRQGRSGIGVLPSRKELGYHSLLSGIVPRPELKGVLDRRLRNTLSEEAEYAYMATHEALQNAMIDEHYCNSNKIGVVFGNDTSNQSVLQSYLTAVAEHNTMMLGTGLAFQSLTSNVAMNMANIFHLRGTNLTTASACASSAQAIVLAAILIKVGQEDIVVAGGAQETNDQSMIAFDGVNTLSKRNENPQQASRPFDNDRDGLVPSGGAAALVLEEYEHAKARGANILAEVAGYGMSQNDTPLGQPSAEAEYMAMRNALDNAGLKPMQVDYLNAHATSTVAGDMAEVEALTRLFGTRNKEQGSKTPWISSTKSMTGHECWMAGASEVVYSLLMMQSNFIAPSVNIENLMPTATNLNIAREIVYQPISTIMSNSFGFGGTNCSIILKKM